MHASSVLSIVRHVVFSGSLSEFGLKKLATAVSDTYQCHVTFECENVVLVVVAWILLLVGGGDTLPSIVADRLREAVIFCLACPTVCIVRDN